MSWGFGCLTLELVVSPVMAVHAQVAVFVELLSLVWAIDVPWIAALSVSSLREFTDNSPFLHWQLRLVAALTVRMFSNEYR